MNEHTPRQVGFDRRAVLVDGRRQLVLSGAIHYPRSTPEQWPELMRRSREAGLNTIETYVFWCLHERRRGVYDFSGRLDLPRFLDLARRHGLNVILRMGPYACAEINYGGLPPWLRDVPGIRMRTRNAAFQAEVEVWMRVLAERLRPFFAPQGGPVILAQIENEYANIGKYYGAEGEAYLAWSVQLGQSLQLGVPWVMCGGGAEGAIETINAFYGHEQIEQHRRAHPEQPALWTENWPGWYDCWGYARHRRTPRDVAYGVARFIAAGGTGVNYYMWHGGTNFGRESMYLQTAGYDFGGPLNEYGQLTAKGRHLARLHAVLDASAAAILAAEPTVEKLGEGVHRFDYDGGLSFLCNDTEAEVTRGSGRPLQRRSVLILRDGDVLFDSADCAVSAAEGCVAVEMAPEASPRSFEMWPEPLPGDWPSAGRAPVDSPQPVEQLLLTRDQSDYCWYSTEFTVASAEAGGAELLFDGAGDFLSVFVDGVRLATTPTPLVENRTLEGHKDFRQVFRLTLTPGRRRLDVLCAALGLIKGDWMLGFRNQAEERKGIWGKVTWNGRVLAGWRMRAGLLGEDYRVWGTAGGLLPWTEASGKAVVGPCWLRATFARPAGDAPVVLDLGSMGKGLIWLNGECLGRYWLAEAAGRNPISPPAPVEIDPSPGPTQRYYHIPRAWLGEANTLVLLEELGGRAEEIRVCTVSSPEESRDSYDGSSAQCVGGEDEELTTPACRQAGRHGNTEPPSLGSYGEPRRRLREFVPACV